MNNYVKLLAILVASAALYLLSGCGSSGQLNVLASLNPSEITAGSANFSLIVSGSGFNRETRVLFNGTSLVPEIALSTMLQVTVPASLVTKAAVVDVELVGSTTSTALSFTIKNPVPVLSGLSAQSAIADSAAVSLELTGSNFVSTSTVKFGDVTLVPAAVTPGKLTVTVPETLLTTAQILPVAVLNPSPGGGKSTEIGFTVLNPTPAISALSLYETLVNSDDFALILTGTGFQPGLTVSFGSLQLIPSKISSTQASVVVPATAVTRAAILSITAANAGPGGGVSNTLQFRVLNPMPTLTALSRNSGTVGSAFALDLIGTGFVDETAVQFGSTLLYVASHSYTRLNVLIPEDLVPKGGYLSISVTNPGPGGGTSAALPFTMENPRPTLSSVSPTSITANSADASLTLLGTGFVEGIAVSGNNDQLVPISVQPRAITLSVPSALIADAGTLTFSVTAPEPGGGLSNSITVTVHNKAQTGWQTVVNNKMKAPGTTKLFNSYSQPSVNSRGEVVFKGQTKGGTTEPTVGIYTRDMSAGNAAPVVKVAEKNMPVPPPINGANVGSPALYNGAPAGFNMFPSFPRIDRDSNLVAFRGQSQPLWTYTLSDGTETRIGSAGVYNNPGGRLSMGVGLLGSIPGFDYMRVPGDPNATRFDQFPGSPAVMGSTIVFKGNYTTTDGVGKTGIYFRDIVANDSQSLVQMIAHAGTLIPGQPEDGNTVFGSTAPPSAADGIVVFVGLDNEDTPTMGGIYAASLVPNPILQPLVTIGEQVPGEAEGVTFKRLGEGLAFDGRYVGFWAAWGEETRPRMLNCGVDGNKEMIAACLDMYPIGFEAQIPMHQGIFVYDMITKNLTAIAKNNHDEFSDFLYWVFSGHAPNMGGTGEMGEGTGNDVVPEPPRWRSSSFVSVQGAAEGSFQVAFKSAAGSVDGIYLAHGPDAAPILTLVDTTFLGPSIDPEAPVGSTVTSVGLEREGLRNKWLVLNAGMLDSVTGESGAGIYITPITPGAAQ